MSDEPKIFFSCSNFPDCDVIVNDLDDLETKYIDHPKTAYVKKEKKGRRFAKKKTASEEKKPTKKTTSKKPKKTGIQPALQLSKELAALLGEEKLSRPEMIKKTWEYIKQHNLQDPKNKRHIVPDAKLAKIFGSKEPVDMFKLSGLLNKHLS